VKRGGEVVRCCNELLHRPHGGINLERLQKGPMTYAGQLARYMRDPSKVRACTMNEWGRAPTLEQCRDLIEQAQAERDRYRSESDRLEPLDIDGADFKASATSFARDLQVRFERKAAQDIAVAEPEPEAVNDDPEPQRSYFLSETVENVCRAMKVSLSDVMGNARFKPIVRARHVVFYVLHQRGQSLAQIGRRMGCDHTSVMYAMRMWDEKATDNMRAVAAFFVEPVADEVAA